MSQKSTLDSINIVRDYLEWKLKRDVCYLFHFEIELPKPDQTHLLVRFLADKFEQNYGKEIRSSLKRLNLNNLEFEFQKICQAMFEDGNISWGRIVALYSFSGILACYCCKNNLSFMIEPLACWLSSFTDSDLLKWIISRGGWKIGLRTLLPRKRTWLRLLCNELRNHLIIRLIRSFFPFN